MKTCARKLGSINAVLAGVLAWTPIAAGQGYSITELGTLGGSASVGGGIDNLGLIVGTVETVAGADHAFRLANGLMVDLGIRTSPSVATAVNGSGQIAGYYYDRQYRAFVVTDGKLHDLGDLGDNYAVAYG